MKKELRVFFYGGYGGLPKCNVEINGKSYVIELDELTKDLEEAILEKGYTVSKTNRQKYPRLLINK